MLARASPRPQANRRPDPARGIKRHNRPAMALIAHMPADLLPVAIRVTHRFPEKYAGHVVQPTHPEPQNIPRQTINNRLLTL